MVLFCRGQFGPSPIELVILAGVALATYSLGNRCSICLSYRIIDWNETNIHESSEPATTEAAHQKAQ